MIIQNSSIGTSSSRRYSSTQASYIEKSHWDNAAGTSFTEACSTLIQRNEYSASRNGALFDVPKDTTELSEECVSNEDTTTETPAPESDMEALMASFGNYKPLSISPLDAKIEMIRDIQQRALDYLLHILFGKEAKNPSSSVAQIDRTTSAKEASATNLLTQRANELGENLGTGGSHYTFYYCAETETTCFDAKGIAITADGRELSFNISMEMSRSFVEMSETQCNFGQPRLCDPLVINLNSNIASVSDQKFFFDVDADGIKDEISMLDKNSGYLALDHNADGIINDGNELFGTTSGNGFKDLLAYDEDGNGWIDEADSIFKKLKIWSMDENGNSTLIDLLEAGVGAIYLGYEDTAFSLNNAENKTNAIIQKTGLFLFEDGTSGTIQQLDLAV